MTVSRQEEIRNTSKINYKILKINLLKLIDVKVDKSLILWVLFVILELKKVNAFFNLINVLIDWQHGCKEY